MTSTITHRLRPLVAALVLFGCHSATSPSSGETPVARGLLEGSRSAVPTAPAMLRVRQADGVRIALEDARSPTDETRAPEMLRLNLFEDATFDAQLVEVGRRGGALVWRGEILGHPGGEALLATRDGALSASIRVDGRLFTIEPRAEGPLVVEWDESLVPGDAPSPAPDLVGAPVAADPLPAAAASPDTVAEVDVLVLYTAEAAERGGGAAGVEATVALAVEEANRSYAASGISARLTVLDTRRTTYDESDFDFDQTLLRLALPGDGHLDDAPAARDEVGADHVVLIVDHAGPYAGIGYQMTGTNAGIFAPSAYAVVSRDYAAGHFTFAHELGHNMGANHDPANAADGYHHDSRGHQAPAEGWRTVMAYSCEGVHCGRVGRWSNPALRHEGHPTGVSGVSDNARTLNETAHITAGFRERAVAPPTGAGPHWDARIVTPKDRSVLDAGAVTFEWTDVGADAYALMIGERPGDGTHLHVPASAQTRFVARDLPQDGRTLYARLWTLRGAEWGYVDHVFTAHQRVLEGAILRLPRRRITGSWSHFAWDDVEGARAYRLEVGSDNEPGRWFDREVDGTAALVVGLPVDGREVIARLHTLGPEGWVVTRRRLRTWRAPSYTARLERPAPRERGESSVTYRWTELGARDHWLVVLAGTEVVESRPVSGGAHTVRGIPRDADDLLVLLYSRGPDGWVATSARQPVAD